MELKLIRLRLNAKKGMKMKRKKIVKAYLSDEEYSQVVLASETTGLTISKFVKNVCLGTPLPNKDTTTFRLELLQTAADMGRLGGLLKMAISNGMERRKVQPLLEEIQQRQKELKQIASKIQ